MNLCLVILVALLIAVTRGIPTSSHGNSRVVLINDSSIHNDDFHHSGVNLPRTPEPDMQNFNKMFEFVDGDLGIWPGNEKNMAGYAMVEALQLLYSVNNLMSEMDPDNPTSSFKRYFPQEYTLRVELNLNGLVDQLGGLAPGWDTCRALDEKQLPLKLFYHYAPKGAEDRDHCDQNEAGTHKYAYMSPDEYEGKTAGQIQFMVICKYFFESSQPGRPEFLQYRSIEQLQVAGLDNYASRFGREPGHRGWGGMEFAGVTLLHELLHWRVLESLLPEREGLDELDDLTFDTQKGHAAEALGPWAAQELKRTWPQMTVENVENYVWFMLEAFWQARLPAEQEFVDAPAGNDGGYDWDHVGDNPA